MEQLIFEGTVSNGELSLKNLPITDGTEVEVVVLPKFKFDKASSALPLIDFMNAGHSTASNLNEMLIPRKML